MKVESKVQIPNKKNYTSMCMYINLYYLLDNNKVDIYNFKFDKISSINLGSEYTSITFNKYFYLTKKNDYRRIYVFNNHLEEINVIELKKVSKKNLTEITSIVLNNDNFIITTKTANYKVSKDGYYIEDIIIKKHPITISNDCNRRVINHYQTTTCISNKLLVAYDNLDSGYIYNVSPNFNIINKYYIDDNIFIHNILRDNDKLILLVSKDKLYNYIYIIDLSKDRNIHNYSNCDNEIINSIAKEENDIAKLIQALANKVNYVIENEQSFDKLIKVNNEVNKTLVNIINLEKILSDKLRIVCKK